ncbi:hypothetical protein P9112_008712 [Eukaryota sp. TZLM1-RC]
MVESNEMTIEDANTNWCHSDIRSFRALQMANSFCQILTDGPVSWKLNFFRTMATFFECSCPKKYASLVVNTTAATIPDSLRAWYDEGHHEYIMDLFTQQVADPHRFDAMLMLDNVDLSSDNITFLFTAGLNILSLLENIASDTMRRNAIDPNHKNLCGYSIGSRIDNNNVDHQLSDPCSESKGKEDHSPLGPDPCIT